MGSRIEREFVILADKVVIFVKRVKFAILDHPLDSDSLGQLS